MAWTVFYCCYQFLYIWSCKSAQVLACYWCWFRAKEVGKNPWSKVRNKLIKPFLSFSLWNICKEILWPCNFLVLCVYDLSTSVTNQDVLLNDCGCGVDFILLLISLCGYLKVWVHITTLLVFILSHSKTGRKDVLIKGKIQAWKSPFYICIMKHWEGDLFPL